MATSYVIIACYPDKGMKSYGSKSLIDFNKKKLLQHQIDIIRKHSPSNSEIIVVSDFETQKIVKHFSAQALIVPLETSNPIYTGCENSTYNNIIFIDYGCVFRYGIIKKITTSSSVVCSNSIRSSKLDIGCLVEDNKLKHIFLDLPNHRFCNMFSVCEQDKFKILQNKDFGYFNLLSFEIINMLVDSGSKFDVHDIKQEDFIYFNHMRQKNAVTKFIKKITN
jgi:hypothetical protein